MSDVGSSADSDADVRVAVERVSRVTLQMWDELGRVDSKASTLIGLIGAAFAVTLAGLSQTESTPTLIFGAVGLVLFAASVLTLVLTVRPVLVNQDPVAIYSFRYFARATKQELQRDLGCSDAAYLEHVGVRLNVLAQLAERKYVRLRLAVDLLAAGLISTSFAGGASLFL